MSDMDPCAVCLEKPTKPVTLPCAHSYCQGCIAQWAKVQGSRQRGNTTCPTCNQPFDAPSVLPTKLLQVPRGAGQTQVDEARHCQLCAQDMGPHVVELRICEHAFCRDCLKENAHQQRERFPNLDHPDCPICGQGYSTEQIGERWIPPAAPNQRRSPHPPRPPQRTTTIARPIARDGLRAMRPPLPSVAPQYTASQREDMAAIARRILGPHTHIRIQGHDVPHGTIPPVRPSHPTITSPPRQKVTCPQCLKQMLPESLKRHKKQVHGLSRHRTTLKSARSTAKSGQCRLCNKSLRNLNTHYKKVHKVEASKVARLL